MIAPTKPIIKYFVKEIPREVETDDKYVQAFPENDLQELYDNWERVYSYKVELEKRFGSKLISTQYSVKASKNSRP